MFNASRSRNRKQNWPQSRESREIIGETETKKMDSRRDQSRGLESRLQALGDTYILYIYIYFFSDENIFSALWMVSSESWKILHPN